MLVLSRKDSERIFIGDDDRGDRRQDSGWRCPAGHRRSPELSIAREELLRSRNETGAAAARPERQTGQSASQISKASLPALATQSASSSGTFQ